MKTRQRLLRRLENSFEPPIGRVFYCCQTSDGSCYSLAMSMGIELLGDYGQCQLHVKLSKHSNLYQSKASVKPAAATYLLQFPKFDLFAPEIPATGYAILRKPPSDFSNHRDYNAKRVDLAGIKTSNFYSVKMSN